MHKFDRLLDGHNVLGKIFIDKVNERSLCGCFAGASRASDEHKPAAQISEVFDDCGNTQLFERRNLGGDQSKRRGVSFGLLKIVGAKARMLIHLVGKIKIAMLLKNLPVTWTADLAQHLRSFVVR